MKRLRNSKRCFNWNGQKQLKQFVSLMEKKLKKTAYKGDRGGWLRCSEKYLFDRLVEETEELHLALKNKKGIVGECCDVANFAMMIADKRGLK